MVFIIKNDRSSFSSFDVSLRVSNHPKRKVKPNMINAQLKMADRKRSKEDTRIHYAATSNKKQPLHLQDETIFERDFWESIIR
jgi:hypothetical protein